MAIACIDCLWFKSHDETATKGICKRYPPTMAWDSEEQVPVTIATPVYEPEFDYCGEFEELGGVYIPPPYITPNMRKEVPAVQQTIPMVSPEDGELVNVS